MTTKEAIKHVPGWFASVASSKAPLIVSYVTSVESHSDAISTKFIVGYTEFAFIVHEFESASRYIAQVNFIQQPPGKGILSGEGNQHFHTYSLSEELKKKMVEAVFDIEE